jgi:DNA modification methylase
VTVTLHTGDCLRVLNELEADSIDALVSDPPAGIGFMGRDWDKDRGGRDRWIIYWAERFKAALRVLKPGAHGLVWALPRTSHWTATALEDAGFEIRDKLVHIFGQGFPKSHNGAWGGTALKPGAEDWILVRKPLAGTVAATFEAHGTGGLNIDACRIATDWSDRSEAWKRSGHSAKPDAEKIAAPPGTGINCHPQGRWPANVVLSHGDGCELVGTKSVRRDLRDSRDHNNPDNGYRMSGSKSLGSTTEEIGDWRCTDDCPVRLLDEQSGMVGGAPGVRRVGNHGRTVAKGAEKAHETMGFADKGGASRFFYCSKASKKDRGEGNDHPTVKSTELMRYLCRLVTPPRGTVLDLTMGSGSTGVAAVAEGFSFIGIDLDEKSVRTARNRLTGLSSLFARSA